MSGIPYFQAPYDNKIRELIKYYRFGKFYEFINWPAASGLKFIDGEIIVWSKESAGDKGSSLRPLPPVV